MQENVLGLEGKDRQQRRASHHADSMKGWVRHCEGAEGALHSCPKSPIFVPKRPWLLQSQSPWITPLGLSVCPEG